MNCQNLQENHDPDTNIIYLKTWAKEIPTKSPVKTFWLTHYTDIIHTNAQKKHKVEWEATAWKASICGDASLYRIGPYQLSTSKFLTSKHEDLIIPTPLRPATIDGPDAPGEQ